MLETFNNVEESTGGFKRLPVGGYVCKIIDAIDDPKNEFVKIIFDIAEGEHKGFFADDPEWTHTTRVYYKGGAAGMYKRFYMNLSRDNASFDLATYEQTPTYVGMFKNLLFGAVFREYKYIGQDGTPKTLVEIGNTCRVDDIRKNKFEEIEPRVSKEREAYEKELAKPVTVYDPDDDDAPFI